MGTALAGSICCIKDVSIYIFDTDMKKGAALANSIGASFMPIEYIAKNCDFIFLAVKPNVIFSVIDDISNYINKKATVVSMAAGVTLDSIEKQFQNPEQPIIRIMPNTPAAVGRGVILRCKNASVTENIARDFERIMSGAGIVDELDEKLFDAATAISGCGPAFVYMFIEALIEEGVKMGLDKSRAVLYAAKTLEGAAEMVLKSDKSTKSLCENVCSPGGSTIEGVRVLEKGGLIETVREAINASYNKTILLGKGK